MCGSISYFKYSFDFLESAKPLKFWIGNMDMEKGWPGPSQKTNRLMLERKAKQATSNTQSRKSGKLFSLKMLSTLI